DVADARSSPRRRLDRPRKQRLVDVAETGFSFRQRFVNFRGVPGCMPYLDDERIIAETVDQRKEIVEARRIVAERPWKLQQDGAKLAGFDQWIDSLAIGALILHRGGSALVGKCPIKFGGELEVRTVRGSGCPGFRGFRGRRAIEAAVD